MNVAKLKVYSVHDVKVKAYARPFFMRTSGEALRGWIEVVNDPESAMSKYPQDFALFEIAEYDEETGHFSNVTPPLCLGLAIEFKEQPKATPLEEAILKAKSACDARDNVSSLQ